MKGYIKLSEYAKKMNVHYTTALRWYNANAIKEPTMKMPSGSIFVKVDSEHDNKDTVNNVSIYARVSSHDQKNDLERQVARLTEYALENGYTVTSIHKEIASGMNQNRKVLLSILKDSSVNTILVENKDRFSRFGFNLVKGTLNSCGRDIIVSNKEDEELDLVQDFVDVITSMCARIYGKRSAKNKHKTIQQIIEENN